MDRYERFYRRSLRDVLVGQGIISAELADELAESAYEAGEAFGYAVVDAGHMSAWDLTKVVAGHYQMPVLPLAGYEFDDSIMDGMSAATLYQYQVLPVDRFGRAWSFAVAEPPSRDCVAALREAFGSAIFFFVADAEVVKNMVREHVKVVDATSDKGWQSLFDSADAAIKDEILPEATTE
ncbi:MAG: hypothetical protein O2894_02985 [Planctomycetota bacterium]|nr:hypothetical protein [Planctomycetota bacterium]